MDNFPCLALARRCAQMGGTACAAMNGANEEAVALFLEDRIGFYDIYDLVNRAVEEVPNVMEPTLEDILETDRLARQSVRNNFEKM
jgi:1-deoxy-D-xylulose-5-phosphate reductoisomerase